jgi:hypothetical protein
MYLTATNNDLKRTQNLLHNSVPEEFKVEELSPIPESIVFKDRNLFDAFMKSQMLPTYYN